MLCIADLTMLYMGASSGHFFCNTSNVRKLTVIVLRGLCAQGLSREGPACTHHLACPIDSRVPSIHIIGIWIDGLLQIVWRETLFSTISLNAAQAHGTIHHHHPATVAPP